jgi:hypothetical protein
MTLAHLKSTLEVRLFGENKYKSDDAMIKVLLRDALFRVSNACIPLVLLTANIGSSNILRQVDEYYYIREPNIPTVDEDVIDIDTSLELAVIYFICAAIAKNPTQNYQQMAQEIIDAHRWVAYEYLQKKEIVDDLHNS